MVNHKKMSDEQKKMMSSKMTGRSRNPWEVLDEGELKCVPEVTMVKTSYYMKYLSTKYPTRAVEEWEDDRLIKRVVDNEKYIEPTNRMKWADKEYERYRARS